jgi:hypothetical protein
MYAATVVQAPEQQTDAQEAPEQQTAAQADAKPNQEQFTLTLSGFTQVHILEEVKEHIIKKYALVVINCSKIKQICPFKEN